MTRGRGGSGAEVSEYLPIKHNGLVPATIYRLVIVRIYHGLTITGLTFISISVTFVEKQDSG